MPAPVLTTQFLQAGCYSCRPTISVNTLKANQSTTNPQLIEPMEFKPKRPTLMAFVVHGLQDEA